MDEKLQSLILALFSCLDRPPPLFSLYFRCMLNIITRISSYRFLEKWPTVWMLALFCRRFATTWVYCLLSFYFFVIFISQLNVIHSDERGTRPRHPPEPVHCLDDPHLPWYERSLHSQSGHDQTGGSFNYETLFYLVAWYQLALSAGPSLRCLTT